MVDRVPRTARARARASSKEELGKRSTRVDSFGGESFEEELLETGQFPPGVEPAFVRVAAGQTYNLGNFESMRIDVSVTLPCVATEKGVEAAYARASDFVAEKLANEEAQWLPSAPSSKSSKRK